MTVTATRKAILTVTIDEDILARKIGIPTGYRLIDAELEDVAGLRRVVLTCDTKKEDVPWA